MIVQFPADSGKKSGEFYTPQAVSELMTRIALDGKEQQKGISIYDIKTVKLLQLQTEGKDDNVGVLKLVA